MINSLAKVFVLASAFSVAVGASAAHALPLVPNGGFETPVLTPGTNAKLPNTTSGIGWAGSGPSGVEIFTSNFFSGVLAYEGNQFGEVQNDALTESLSQTISGFVIGNSYSFTFAHRGRSTNETLKFQVKDGATPLIDSNFTAGTSAWVLNTGNFVASNTSLDVIFTGVNSIDPVGQPGVGNFIDAVSFAEVPGPLPLVGAASAFAFSRRIRRRISKGLS
jgi:hypothetical protein